MALLPGSSRRHSQKNPTPSFIRREKKSIRSRPFSRRITFATSICAALFAIFLISSFLTHQHTKPSTNIPTQRAVASPPRVSIPTQDNPLFAKKPSWSQNFADPSVTGLDSKYWNALVGPAENSNKELQYYTDNPSNLRIENNALRLVATHESEPQGYKYGSARLETQGKKAFLYGRIDVTAKLPAGSGTWPAVWMLPDNDTYAKKSANDPLRYKNGGEIDIFESVGFQPDTIYGVAHTASDVSLRPDGTGSYKSVTVSASSANFNTYTLLWTPTAVTFAVNGTSYYTYARQDGADYKTWPFDQPFYLIANLAMGGTWGGLDTAHYPGTGIDDSVLPSSLDIRSIYYYPYVGSKAVK